MNTNTITSETIATETYAAVALRTRALCMSAGPRFEWIDATATAVRLTGVVSATPAGGNSRTNRINFHLNAKQDRPPREDLR